MACKHVLDVHKDWSTGLKRFKPNLSIIDKKTVKTAWFAWFERHFPLTFCTRERIIYLLLSKYKLIGNGRNNPANPAEAKG